MYPRTIYISILLLGLFRMNTESSHGTIRPRAERAQLEMLEYEMQIARVFIFSLNVSIDNSVVPSCRGEMS